MRTQTMGFGVSRRTGKGWAGRASERPPADGWNLLSSCWGTRQEGMVIVQALQSWLWGHLD